MRFWIFNLGHLVQMHAILRNDYLSVSINACPLVEMYLFRHSSFFFVIAMRLKWYNCMNVFQVCAPSCHDCSTLRAWWEEDEERRQRYFSTMVGSDLLPPSRCVPEIANFIIRQHLEAPSMWAIFPLQVL